MKITQEKIQELKSTYGQLFQVSRKGSDYILRFPSLKEWKEARSKDSSFATNDKLVQTCLVFPELKELRVAEKADAYLVEVLGIRLMTEVLRDDEGDEGRLITNDDGSMLFKINRKGIDYTFRFPTRAEWKRISGLIGTSNMAALDVLVTQCILHLSEADIAKIEENDVAFTEQVGAPFLKVIIQDWADSEGKRI